MTETRDTTPPAATSKLCKRFKNAVALDDVSLTIPRGAVVGLVGRNGCGKTTLLRHLAGLMLPSSGSCQVFGRPSHLLGDADLARLGVVHQETRLLSWMSVRQHLAYVRSFYEHWDLDRQQRLLDDLQLDPAGRIGQLSPGNLQKLAVVTAVCHRPELLLLDEPVSALDPIARETLLEFLLQLLHEDGTTILVSSHVLRDVERVVERILCLEAGRVVVDESLDDLRERYAEWRVVSQAGGLPPRFPEGFVLEQQGDRHQARLCVRDAAGYRAAFERQWGAEVATAPLNLERMFPLWVGRRSS
ncbi:MAG: ABC transporter ATP-binding protein [Planctomycetota bacterium]